MGGAQQLLCRHHVGPVHQQRRGQASRQCAKLARILHRPCRRQLRRQRLAHQHQQTAAALPGRAQQFGQLGLRLCHQNHGLVVVHRGCHTGVQAHLGDLQRVLARAQGAPRQVDALFTGLYRVVGRRHVRHQAQAESAVALYRGQVTLARSLVQAAHPAPEVDLVRRHRGLHVVQGHAGRCAAGRGNGLAACGTTGHIQPRQADRLLDAVLRPRLRDAGHRGGQITVVNQGLGNQELQLRVTKKSLPGDLGGQLGARRLTGGIGVELRSHGHRGLFVERSVLAGRERPTHGQSEEPIKPHRNLRSRRPCQTAAVPACRPPRCIVFCG